MLTLFLSFQFCILLGQNDSLAPSRAGVFRYNASYQGELQFNILNKHGGKPKNVNLVTVATALSTDKWWKNGLFELSFLSVFRTTDRPIIEDMLTFSNLDSPNRWLICSKLGYQHTFANLTLFLGVRNVNGDYFTGDYTSFFTNSSSGIYPSISLNHAAANYPLAALGFHAEYKLGAIELKNSLYDNLSGVNENDVFRFRFNPKKYGYINFSQIKYETSTSSYAIGMVSDKHPQESVKHSLFVLGEQQLYAIDKRSFGVIAQLGYVPYQGDYRCKNYYGVGLVASGLFDAKYEDRLGLMLSHAKLEDTRETAIELTYRKSVSSYLSIQPALHYIHNNKVSGLVGLVRISCTLGN